MGAVSLCGALSGVASAQAPDHPIITEVFQDPPGLNDGPVRRDLTNPHQSFIEIYLPSATELDPGLAVYKDALSLTFYEVEGDSSSSGLGLINYRIDLPPFDLDASNGTTPGTLARPASGVVVLGWVDYLGDPPTDLAGTPATRIGLINGGIFSATEFVFVAINGAQFSGTSNFPVPVDVSAIHMPQEATSGIIQNGSGVYLLVNRDAPGYAQLFDDKDTAHVPPISNANPDLPAGTVLQPSSVLDGFATNNDQLFDPNSQPYAAPTGLNIDLETVLPRGGAYSLLTPQLIVALGHQRLFADVAKTTENSSSLDDDPVVDFKRYRPITTLGPLGFPTPGRVLFTTSSPELSVADAALQVFEVIAGTTGRPGLRAANAGGDFPLEVSATPGVSSNPLIMTFASGDSGIAAVGQTEAFPKIEASVPLSAADGATVTVTVEVAASNLDPGAPPVINPLATTSATFRVLSPVTGLDAAGLPFQATTLAAIQGVPDDPGVANEFRTTSLGLFVAANLGGLVKDDRGHGLVLLDPLTNLSDPVLMDALEDDMPDDPVLFINPPSAPGLPDLLTTILSSAEVQSGKLTYAGSVTAAAVRALELTIPETWTAGGTFVPTERVHFVDATGRAEAGSPFLDASSARGFELALVDTNVRALGGVETGATDDFGLVVQVGRTRASATVVPGEFLFLSYLGGLEGADIDTLDVPPHQSQTILIYLDLDALDTVLGAETITRLYVIDGSGTGDINLVEVFSLNALGLGRAQSKSQQKCIKGLNGSLFKVMRVQSRDIFGCVKS
ncbi:MAG: hypothetical protein V3T14_10715, partial [Myxococcota bacterium]